MKTNNTLELLKNHKIITVFIIILSTLFVTNLNADDAIFRTVVSKNDLSVGGDFWLDVQIRITAGTSPRTLNSLTVDVYFGNQISYSSADNWAYSLIDGYSPSANYLTTYIRVGTTGNSVNLYGGGNPAGWDVTTLWQTVVTLKFTIVIATSVNISINDNTDAAAYFNNLHNNPTSGVTDWATSNEDTGDVTLPVVLSAFTAQYINKKAELYWVTESETDNLGWNIYRNYTNDLNSAEIINDEFIEGHGTTTEQSQYFYSDNIISPNSGDKFWYWLVSISYNGIIHSYDPTMLTIPENEPQQEEFEIPEIFGLFQNSPNPFNPENESTHLYFNLPKTNRTVLKIYNSKGQFIKKIFEGISDKGAYCWDGKDYQGKVVPSGIYLYILEADNDIFTKKMIILNN